MPEFDTPMMKQYQKIKAEYPDCLLFFRLGDFYELFLEDAKTGSKVLGITLTSRSRGKDGRIPMAGVPYHAVDSYLSKLVKEGYKVAICEQVSEPGNGKLVEREVVRVVTPGTLLDQKVLDSSQNNYIAAILKTPKKIGFAFADVSTGTFITSEHAEGDHLQILADQFSKFNPVETLVSDSDYENQKLLGLLSSIGTNVYRFSGWNKYSRRSSQVLKKHFSVSTLVGFNLDGRDVAVTASAVLLGYLKETQKDKVSHIKKIETVGSLDYVELGRSTIYNLELFSTIREGEKRGSLISVLDKTQTSFGSRLLRHWLVKPLANKNAIVKRQVSVEELLKNRVLRSDLRTNLSAILDVERILSKVSVGVGNARDLIMLRDSLIECLRSKKTLGAAKSPLLKDLECAVSPVLSKIIDEITTTLVEEPPLELKQGGLIHKGYSSRLDALKKSISDSQEWISSLEAAERRRTGISSLKVGYNKVFGYYIEISKSNLELVPENYVRKQTLVNAERFITQKLKEQEELVLAAEETINGLEYVLYRELEKKVLGFTGEIQKSVHAIARLDCLASLAEIAENYDYTKPQIVESGELKIVEGRHPVVEQLLTEKQFVPNDVTLNHKDHQLLIITGPNMAGKSVYIRQVGLITLLAHLGSFVPAESATIPLVDKIFVRSGASDFITSGLSTFMVEMVETAQILNNATEKSLILLDEVGRGTTTYDGVSIAWAIAEYLLEYKVPFAKTLFATHYHELQDLAKEFALAKNYQVVAREEFGKPVFLHKVVSGGASHSYGVAVAKLAGVPEKVTQRALDVLSSLESREFEDWLHDSEKSFQNLKEPSGRSLENTQVIQKLKKVDPNVITPIEALVLLKELHDELKKQV